MQLPLPVRLRAEASFESFHVHPGVAAAVAGLQAGLAAPPFGILLHGPRQCGLSHLLQACCHRLEAAGDTVVYLPLAALAQQPPGELLEGLEHSRLVCLDDLDAVAGQADWERALFGLYNRLQAGRGSLLVASRLPPAALAIALPDLRSRLQALLVIAVAPPDDAARMGALQLLARTRGLALEPEVARYILARAPRGMEALVGVLDALDQRSLAAGRRLSIPFVREVMGWQA